MSLEYIYSDINTLNSLMIHKSEDFFSITLIKDKYLSKRKALMYEHVLLTEEVFKKFLLAVESKSSDAYFSCCCNSEVLRLMYDEELDLFYIALYDNYYLKLPKFVAQEVYFDGADLLHNFENMASLCPVC